MGLLNQIYKFITISFSSVVSTSHNFITISTARTILNQICLHLLPYSNLYPGPFSSCVLSTSPHFKTLSTARAILNPIHQLIKNFIFPKLHSKDPTPSKQNAVVILALKQVLQSIQICNSYPFLSASDYFLGVLFQNLVILTIFTARIILNQTFLHLLPIFTQLEPFNHVYFQHLIIL